MNSLPLLPIIIVDIIGSTANIAFAFLATRYAWLLSRKHPDNFLWGYLFLICLAIAAFSISRAAGHLVKQILMMSGYETWWQTLSPYSGAFNTLFMITVSAVIIFYHKGVQAYETIEQKTAKLEETNIKLFETATELTELNLSLEEEVEKRALELSKSEKKFHHLFSASKDMVYFCDTELNIVDINESGKNLIGWNQEEILQFNLTDIFNNSGELSTYSAMLKKNGYVNDLEVEFRKVDGSIIYVLISAAAIYDDLGNMTGCEGIAKDLTRIKAMMGQLVASEKMASVGSMAAGIAHEINTPIGIILGYAQLMKDDFEEDSETYQNLLVIERQSQASRRIVADLLKFSRQSKSAREDISINEVLGDIIAVTEHSLNIDHILINLSLADNLPMVTGDAEKLRQVIVNLINNAHHAMEEDGGELFLSSEYDRLNKQVTVAIRDTGTGVAEEIKTKIFDPFFTTKPVGKGTGLGLSVSYGIIQEHGGIIEVISPVGDEKQDAARPGTAFIIKLPASTVPEPAVLK